MAKLFHPIRFWIARFTSRKSSDSSSSSCPFASLARPPARHPHGGGLSFAVLQAALHPRNTLPPPRRAGLRFPTPVGHGRGLAARPGCAGPGESIDSARRRLHRFRRVSSPRPSRFRLRLRSSMPEARLFPIVSAHYSASTGPASSLADPDHASSFSLPPNCSKKPPPRLKYQSRSRPDRRHARFRQTPRRRISDNAIYV